MEIGFKANQLLKEFGRVQVGNREGFNKIVRHSGVILPTQDGSEMVKDPNRVLNFLNPPRIWCLHLGPVRLAMLGSKEADQLILHETEKKVQESALVRAQLGEFLKDEI